MLHQLKLLEFLVVVTQTPDLIRRAVELFHTYKIGFRDACIIGAAERAGCTEIYSEDLNAGQAYAGIKLSNPLVV